MRASQTYAKRRRRRPLAEDALRLHFGGEEGEGKEGEEGPTGRRRGGRVEDGEEG